jgi:hypothetical protein
MKWSGPCKTARKSLASAHQHHNIYALTARKMCSQRVVTFVICMLISSWMVAQTDVARSANGTKPDAQTAGPVGNGTSPVPAHDNTYVIGVDDVLAINVWKEPEISRTVPVRSDGKISLPLVGQVQASGESPHQLEKALAAKLQSFISEPEVTVTVTEVKSQKFNVPGQVSRPGSYPTNSPTVPPGTDLPLLLPWRSLHG